MDADRWSKIRTLFQVALDTPSDKQQAFVKREAAAAGFDEEMLAELHALLAADQAAQKGDVDAMPTLQALANAAPELVAGIGEEVDRRARDVRAGQQFGRWKLQREIGRGGMGTVYLAERVDSDFHQSGALKLIESPLPSERLQRRFLEERRILAGLDHPGIARLLDGDEGPEGQPFLVMEYVDGVPIDRYADQHRLDLNKRLLLFLDVCEIVSDAHRNLVVHRDLKPSNILVTPEGRVKLLDFGIARIVEPEALADATATRMFTPGYAAPEQLRGEPATTAVDVHALGLLLYQLLTGCRAWSRTASTPFAYEQAILNDMPTLPSRILDEPGIDGRKHAMARSLGLNALRAALKGDLDAIVMMALRKSARDRYPSVDALAGDVRNYLHRRPVAARRGTRRYQLSRFVVRHRLPVALSGLLVAVLLGGLVALALQAQQIRVERDQAIVERERADAMVAFQRQIFRQANPNHHQGREPTASELLDFGERLIVERDDLPRATRAALLYEMANSRFDLAGFSGAAELADQARDLYDLEGDINGAWLSATLSAKSSFNIGRIDDAESVLASLLSSDSAAAVTARTRAEVLYLQGLIHGNRGETEQGVELLRESARLFHTTGEGYQQQVLKVLNPAAAYLGRAGYQEEAMAVLSELQAMLGDGPLEPVVEHSLASTTAVVYQLARRWPEARQQAERRLALAIDIYGPESDYASFAYAQMAAIAHGGRDFKAAEEWYQRAYEIRQHTSGPDSASTLFALRELARIDLYHGKLDEVDAKLARVIEGYTALYGADSPSVIQSRSIGLVGLEARGNFREVAAAAADMKRQAPDAFEKVLEEYRYRMELIMLAYGEDVPDCESVLELPASLSTNTPPLVAEFYFVDCLRRLGREDEAIRYAATLDPTEASGLDTDPALRALRDQVLGMR